MDENQPATGKPESENSPRIGVRIPRELPAARLTGLVRRAERVGLDEVWVVEDCFYAGGIATAATALAVTESVTVGIGVLPTVARSPAIAAMEIAALTGLHPGRLVAGFGHGVASWMRQIDAYPPSPLAALGETLTAVRRLLAGENVSVSGRHVRLDGVRLEFPPAVVPPVFAGVRGPKSLVVSGASADGTVLAEPAAPEYVRAARAAIEVGQTDPAGPHPIVTYNWFALDGDPDRATERARSAVASALTPGTEAHLRPLPFGDDLLNVIGDSATTDELAARLRPEWIEHLSISGDLGRCVEQVRRLHAAGSESVVLLPLDGEPEEAAVDAAGEVAEALRRSPTEL